MELLKTAKKPLGSVWQEEHQTSSLTVLKAACCPLSVCQAAFAQVCFCAERLTKLILLEPGFCGDLPLGCCESVVLSDVFFLTVFLKSSLGLQTGVFFIWLFLLFVCLLFLNLFTEVNSIIDESLA